MKTPNPGDILTKQQILDLIIAKANEAYSNDKNGYEDLRDICEICFGNAIDFNLSYNKELQKFEVYEDVNYN